MPVTRGRQPPLIPIPDYSILYHLDFDFTDEKVIRSDPFIESINNFFNEAKSMNENAKRLIADKTKKKVPNTPKKKVAATSLVISQIAHFRAINFDDEESLIDDLQQASSHHTLTPSRFQNVGTPNFANSKPKTVVPKAATVKPQDPNLKEKIDHGLKNATERRNEHNKEKAEKTRREREEKAKKNEERRLQKEEETRRQLEAARTKEAKQREFEAKQREEAKTVPTTPKQDKRKKAVLTPRNAQIPPKKGKNIPQQNDFDVSSPVRKHKKPTPPKPAVDEEMQSEPEVENYEEEEEVTTYVELTVEEAEAEIRERMSRPRVLSFDNYVPPPPPPERLPSLMKTVKLEDTTDIVDETIQSPSAFKTPVPQKLFNSVLQESSLQERCDEPIPMEDFEDTNAENMPPPSFNKTSYDITADKIPLPSTETNYNVDDLSSNDETDDESRPRKTVPNWAKKPELNTAVKEMLRDTTMAFRCRYFGVVQEPTTEYLFDQEGNRHRNSSQYWQSPLTNPTPGVSRLQLRHR